MTRTKRRECTMTFARRDARTFKTQRMCDAFTFNRNNARTQGFRHHMRVGRFAIIVCIDDIAVIDRFDDDASQNDIPRTSPYYERSRDDRLRQHEIILENLTLYHHPMRDDVIREIDAERARILA